MLALLMLLFSATALAEEQMVYDDAELLTAEEADNLNARLNTLRDTYGMDFVALTCADTQGKESNLFCADFFEQMDFGLGVGKDGLVLCIDMDNRQIMLVTHGGLIQIVDDDREESVYDAMYDDVSNGYYYDAFTRGFDQLEEYVIDGPRHGQFTYDKETGAISGYYYAEDSAYLQAGLESGEIYYDEASGTYYYNQNYTPSFAERLKRAFTPGGVIFASVVGALAAWITMGIVRRKYRKDFEDFPYDYASNSRMVVVRKDDKLVNKFVTTRIIPKTDDSSRSGGGGSSSGFGSGTFSSSSGGTFGGGSGRSF